MTVCVCGHGEGVHRGGCVAESMGGPASCPCPAFHPAAALVTWVPLNPPHDGHDMAVGPCSCGATHGAPAAAPVTCEEHPRCTSVHPDNPSWRCVLDVGHALTHETSVGGNEVLWPDPGPHRTWPREAPAAAGEAVPCAFQTYRCYPDRPCEPCIIEARDNELRAEGRREERAAVIRWLYDEGEKGRHTSITRSTLRIAADELSRGAHLRTTKEET